MQHELLAEVVVIDEVVTFSTPGRRSREPQDSDRDSEPSGSPKKLCHRDGHDGVQDIKVRKKLSCQWSPTRRLSLVSNLNSTYIY